MEPRVEAAGSRRGFSLRESLPRESRSLPATSIARACALVRPVRRAVIPAAGRGTRMHPFSLSVPKELAPLGSTPAIHFVLDEAERAGIDEAIVVTAPGKELLRRHLELAQAQGAWPGLRLRFAMQEEPTGLADAIALAGAAARVRALRGAPARQRLARPGSSTRTLLDLWRARQRGGRRPRARLRARAASSATRVASTRGRSRAARSRSIACTTSDRAASRSRATNPCRVLRACGRYVFGSDVFDAARRRREGNAIGELDEVPAVQRLARDGSLIGALLPMPLFDVGHPIGAARRERFISRAADRRSQLSAPPLSSRFGLLLRDWRNGGASAERGRPRGSAEDPSRAPGRFKDPNRGPDERSFVRAREESAWMPTAPPSSETTPRSTPRSPARKNASAAASS